MNRTYGLITAFLLAGCASSSPPKGQNADEHAIAKQTLSAMFYTLDCTDEGHLEAGEIGEHMAQLFRPFDVDRSISLSRKEFQRASRLSDPSQIELAFALSDANTDGQVTGPEFAHYLAHLLDVVDADRDGEITPSELGDERLGR